MKKINSAEIAKIAGVSRSTVSRVINNYSNVPDKTRDKIMKIIEEHNYFPNASAQALAGKKNRVLGLFLIGSSHISDDILTNIIVASVIEAAAAEHYYVMTSILHSTEDKQSVKSIKEVFYQQRIDAGIFIGAANEEPFIEELIAEGFIVGVVDQLLTDMTETNRIVMNFDNIVAGEQAVDYLASLNHKYIGIINGDMNRLSGPAKLQGYIQGMQKHKLAIQDEWVLDGGDFNEQSGFQALEAFLGRKLPLPTAIIAVNDSVAFGAMKAMQQYGIQIPKDISVIGFDNHILSSYHKPALTTFKVDFKQMMHRLTQAVMSAVDHEPDKLITMNSAYELIIRDSCRRINQDQSQRS